MQFPATLPLAGRKAPFPQPNRDIFRLDLSISGNFQQIYLQLVEKHPFQQLNRTFILDWNYPFQVISSNFGFSWQKMPVAEQGHILDWIYPFQAISSNFRFSQQKSPLPPRTEQGQIQTGSIHFRKFPATLGSAGSKASPFPRSQTGKHFRLDLFISGNFWQLWFQLAENPMSCIGIFLDWIYTFQAISSNFGLSWQKNPQPRNQKEFFTLDLSISGHFQQLWAQLAEKLPLRSQTGNFLD